MNAIEILENAVGHMKDRAEQYDAPDGERSIEKTVDIFNLLTGCSLSHEDGWVFMGILKMVRSRQGQFKADNYEDGAAYFALAGEAASREA